jgi:protein TonB
MQVGDRYLEALSGRPRARKLGTLAMAILLHGATITGLIVWNVCQVKELPAPPDREIIWRQARPILMTGGPKIEQFKKMPAIKQGVAKKELTQPPTEIAKATPVERADDKPIGDPEGREDATSEVGDKNGQGNGPATGPGGGGTGEVCPVGLDCSGGTRRMLDPTVAASYRVYGQNPTYTPQAVSQRIEGTVHATICVTQTGGIASVTIDHGLPLLSDQVLNTVRTWRYKPFMFNGRAMPFCHPAKFEFHLERK